MMMMKQTREEEKKRSDKLTYLFRSSRYYFCWLFGCNLQHIDLWIMNIRCWKRKKNLILNYQWLNEEWEKQNGIQKQLSWGTYRVPFSVHKSNWNIFTFFIFPRFAHSVRDCGAAEIFCERILLGKKEKRKPEIRSIHRECSHSFISLAAKAAVH